MSIKDNSKIDCCAEIHIMKNGVLGFQSNGALRSVVIVLRLDLFVSFKFFALVYSQNFCTIAKKN